MFSHKEDKAPKIKPMLADADNESQNSGDQVLIEINQEDTDEEIRCDDDN